MMKLNMRSTLHAGAVSRSGLAAMPIWQLLRVSPSCPSMRGFVLTLLSFGLWFNSPLASAAPRFHAPEDLALSIGRSSEWAVPKGDVISVSNGAAVRVRDLGTRIRITAKKLGVATIRVGQQVLNVSVIPESAYGLYSALKESLHERRGLQLGVVGRVPVISGRLLRWSDWLSLAEAARRATGHYEFTAALDSQVQIAALSFFRQQLREAHLPDLTLSLEPYPVVSIPLEPKDLSDRVSQVLGPFGFKIQRSSNTLSLEPLVRVQILVTELRRKMFGKLGLDWQLPLEGQLLPRPLLPASGALSFSLQAIEENGLGRVLASPTLLCRSGKEAQFLAGGEFPIKVASFKSHDIAWKKHGVLLRIRPRADDTGRMSIAIETEVSMLDTSQTVDGLPGLLTNRIETHFDLNSGRTIALSGLIKKEWGLSNSGILGFRKIPILGALFGSEEFRDQRTELVIFVTPSIVEGDEAL